MYLLFYINMRMVHTEQHLKPYTISEVKKGFPNVTDEEISKMIIFMNYWNICIRNIKLEKNIYLFIVTLKQHMLEKP